eukprot:752419-Amphidinium_carterae.1
MPATSEGEAGQVGGHLGRSATLVVQKCRASEWRFGEAAEAVADAASPKEVSSVVVDDENSPPGDACGDCH